MGLPSLALLSRGVASVATDYYEDALAFARRNALHNGLPPLETLILNWRGPRSTEAFPLVVAADVLYEARNGDALATLLPSIVAPGGELILADPDRLHLESFLERMRSQEWSVEELDAGSEVSPAGSGIDIRIRLFRIRPVSA